MKEVIRFRKDRVVNNERGHAVKYLARDQDESKPYDVPRYKDDNTLVPEDCEGRPCKACGRKSITYGGPDPCLGYLPGVVAACCGHGVTDGYIMFKNGVILRFDLVVVERDWGK